MLLVECEVGQIKRDAVSAQNIQPCVCGAWTLDSALATPIYGVTQSIARCERSSDRSLSYGMPNNATVRHGVWTCPNDGLLDAKSCVQVCQCGKVARRQL